MHGPDLAEVVVVEAARRLRAKVANADVPARLGESRFAVLTRSGAVRAHLLASQLITALTAPYSAAGTVVHLSAWAGLADLTADTDIDEVIRRATLALRAVRSGPPGTIDWYDEELETRLLRRSTLEQALPGAVSRGELDLRYQPIVELTGGRPVGVEALVSWRHPTLGAISAAEVLSLAEDLGLQREVAQWALHRACRNLVEWRQVHESLWLSINVRPSELVDPSFQTGLRHALETHRIPPSALVVEMAEQDLLRVRDPQQPDFEDVVSQLGRLRAEGVRTAVDNFGTGPTSLSRLRVLPVDLLKIDREVFGQLAGATPTLGSIMDVTVTLGRRLGMEVIAHGLQSPDDLATVRAAGCKLGQGDLLGRAMPAERLEALLHNPRRPINRDS
jgi:EAL domain-containing protein (putative c-di-GMP-specific phosphodiesterase class I)